MRSTRPHILAVEDNSETQLLLKHLLKSSFDVVVVSGVNDALAAADEQDFDIFLLDINLSGQRTGTDLLHMLRKKDGSASVPAIALTAYAMPGDREDFLDAGFDQYVSKPFTRSDLTTAIESSLEPARNTASSDAT
jgi:CheY-like chemotaxis protein